MFKRMACQDRVTLFNVHLNLILKSKAFKEAIDRCHVVIILMFCGLLGLGLNQDCTFIPNFMFVFDNHGQEAAHLFQLTGQVGVEQGFISLATAPKNVVFAVQTMRYIHCIFDDGRAVGEHIGIRIGAGTRHITTVRKHIGGAPKQLWTVLHLGLKVVGHFVKVAVAFGQVGTFRAHIMVVETEIGNIKNTEHIERGVSFHFSQSHRVSREPRPVKRLTTKGIVPFPNKVMPIAHGKAQML